MMKPIEIRLNREAARPLMNQVRPLLDAMDSNLVAPASPPDEDELMVEFWRSDLLKSQQSDLVVLRDLFDDDFLETGRAVLEPEQAEPALRACAAIRLKIRETSLKDIDDLELEAGEIDFADMGEDQTIAYGAYALFASLQELIIKQFDV